MSQLIWELTKKNNSFLVKRNGVEFSSDPYNLVNRNMFAYSGLANRASIRINSEKKQNAKGGVSYNLYFLKSRNWGKVAKKASKDEKKTGNSKQVWTFQREHLPVNTLQTASKVINKKTQYTRRDLKKVALRRLLAVHRAGLGNRKVHTSQYAREAAK